MINRYSYKYEENKMKKSYLLIIAVLSLLAFSSNAQIFNTQNTLKLSKNQHPQKANISDIKWLSGNWVGTGFGNFSQEIWSKPSKHAMLGMFQMLKDDNVVFYEIFHIIEINDSLLLEIKHFNADLTGWESKEKKIQFPLIKIKGQTAWFDGLTYQRKGKQLTAWVSIAEGDKVIEGEFVFHQKD